MAKTKTIAALVIVPRLEGMSGFAQRRGLRLTLQQSGDYYGTHVTVMPLTKVLNALEAAESFMAGFEGNDSQAEEVRAALESLRKAGV